MYKKLPQHIAIVMDGNGRWAENKGLLRIEGHRAGIHAVKSAVQICLEKHIPILSLFAFSSENWSRPKEEVECLMELFVQALDKEIQALHDYNVKVCFIGERCQLSPSLNQQMQAAEILTKDNSKLVLNIAVNYSGKWDILQAAKLIADQAQAGIINSEDINEAFFANNLSTRGLPDPDLLIRTSGEERISNFFLWQLAYTELYFANVQWPDFTREQFELALASFSGRERRYGQISKQLNENFKCLNTGY